MVRRGIPVSGIEKLLTLGAPSPLVLASECRRIRDQRVARAAGDVVVVAGGTVAAPVLAGPDELAALVAPAPTCPGDRGVLGPAHHEMRRVTRCLADLC